MFLKDRHKITSARVYTDEGFLEVPAKLARTGIQDYFAGELGLTDREPTDIIKVFRPEDEVFDEASMKSFQNKPVTDNHPPVLVTADNSKEFAVGHSGAEVARDGIFLTTVLHITDAAAIRNVEDGKVEISNGYTSELKFESGITPEGDAFDAIQTNIKGNHIALVDQARCGAACSLADNLPPDQKETAMEKITIDGVDFEVTDQAAQAVGKLQARLTDAEEESKKKDEDLEKKDEEKEAEKEEMKKDHKKSLDTSQARLDDAVAKAPTPEMLDTLVENRMTTRDAAIKLKADYVWVGKDCETVRKEIVADLCPTVDMETASTDYIRARFDMLAEGSSTQTLDAGLASQLSNDNKKKETGTGDIVADARNKQMADARDAWKGTKA